MSAREPGWPGGVVILGGAHAPIAFARSLSACKDMKIWHVTDDNPLAGYSRAIHRQLRWSGAEHADAILRLEEMARAHGLQGHLLIGAGDPEVKLISQNYERLSALFRLVTRPWEELSFACDKAKAYRRAEDLGIGTPRLYDIRSPDEARAADLRFPVVLKPGMRLADDPFSLAKAWRADTRAEFLAAYEKAAGFVGAQNIVVQDHVPGGGATQFSYTGVWKEGVPLAEFAALRQRQYPVEFGTGTYVEVVEDAEVIEAGRRFLGSIHHHGPVEIEFKRDPRDGRIKLIDVNPRLWTWFGLAEAAGVDYGPLILDIAGGAMLGEFSMSPAVGAAWMYLPRDLFAVAEMMRQKPPGIGVRDYLSSLCKVRAWGVFAWSDMMPAIIDIPLGFSRLMRSRRKMRGA